MGQCQEEIGCKSSSTGHGVHQHPQYAHADREMSVMSVRKYAHAHQEMSVWIVVFEEGGSNMCCSWDDSATNAACGENTIITGYWHSGVISFQNDGSTWPEHGLTFIC